MSNYDPYNTAQYPPTFGDSQCYHQPGPDGNPSNPQAFGAQPGVPVGPGEAVKRFYSKYAQFSGRASRSEYWWVALYLGLIYIALIMLMEATNDVYGTLSEFEFLPSVLMGIFVLCHVVPSIAIGVRRLHDINKSGWTYLIALIPYLGGIVLMALSALSPDPDGARFDR